MHAVASRRRRAVAASRAAAAPPHLVALPLTACAPPRLVQGMMGSGKKGGGVATSEHGVECSVLNQDQGLEHAQFASRFDANRHLAVHWCSVHDTSKNVRTVEARIGEALGSTTPGGGGALVWQRRTVKGLLLAVRKASPPPT